MRQLQDLVGQVFGNLEVISQDESKYNKRYWKYKCQQCGYESSTTTQELYKIQKRGSIGCKECYYRRDLLGKKIGRLTVISYNGSVNGTRTWLCKCDCGNTKILNTGDLNRKDPTLSCGCMRKEKLVNRNIESARWGGDSINPKYKRLYSIWNGMLIRCENSNHDDYKYYGKKGIAVCEEWHDWNTFKEWALNHGYSKDLSIDRKDTYGDYTPDNCKWSTLKEQMNNMTTNRRLTYHGRTQTLKMWTDELGIPYGRTLNRITSGNYTVEEAFELKRFEKPSSKKIS